MTTLDDAVAEMESYRDVVNRRIKELAREGLTFQVVTDPSDPGFDLQVPVARIMAGSSGS